MTIGHIQQGAYTGADLRGPFGGGDEQVLHVQRLDK